MKVLTVCNVSKDWHWASSGIETTNLFVSFWEPRVLCFTSMLEIIVLDRGSSMSAIPNLRERLPHVRNFAMTCINWDWTLPTSVPRSSFSVWNGTMFQSQLWVWIMGLAQIKFHQDWEEIVRLKEAEVFLTRPDIFSPWKLQVPRIQCSQAQNLKQA